MLWVGAEGFYKVHNGPCTQVDYSVSAVPNEIGPGFFLAGHTFPKHCIFSLSEKADQKAVYSLYRPKHEIRVLFLVIDPHRDTKPQPSMFGIDRLQLIDSV